MNIKNIKIMATSTKNPQELIGKYFRLSTDNSDSGILDIVMHITGMFTKKITVYDNNTPKEVEARYFKIDEIHMEYTPDMVRSDLECGTSFNIAVFKGSDILASAVVNSITNDDDYEEIDKTLYDKYMLIYEETKEMQHALMMLHDMK